MTQITRRLTLAVCCVLAGFALHGFVREVMAAEPPQLGATAGDFSLPELDGKQLKLSELAQQGPVVVIVLRGNPGYQCPLCTRQVGQFFTAAKRLQKEQAQVVLIYPGPAAGLNGKAQEFLGDKALPAGFHLVTDGDYTFTNAWNLRWDAPRETAYPSTFVLDGALKVYYAQVSKTHGDRADVEDVLKALLQLQR